MAADEGYKKGMVKEVKSGDTLVIIGLKLILGWPRCGDGEVRADACGDADRLACAAALPWAATGQHPEEWEVEEVRGHKKIEEGRTIFIRGQAPRKGMKYLIKWRGTVVEERNNLTD